MCFKILCTQVYMHIYMLLFWNINRHVFTKYASKLCCTETKCSGRLWIEIQNVLVHDRLTTFLFRLDVIEQNIMADWKTQVPNAIINVYLLRKLCLDFDYLRDNIVFLFYFITIFDCYLFLQRLLINAVHHRVKMVEHVKMVLTATNVHANYNTLV